MGRPGQEIATRDAQREVLMQVAEMHGVGAMPMVRLTADMTPSRTRQAARRTDDTPAMEAGFNPYGRGRQ